MNPSDPQPRHKGSPGPPAFFGSRRVARIALAVARRALTIVLLMLLVSAATFGLSALIPGDFFTTHQTDPTIRRETLEMLRERYGLDRPVLEQYGRWLAGLARLDLGESLFYRQPVLRIIVDAVLRTLWIGIPALLIGLLGGVAVGTLHALARGRWPARILDFLFSIAMSLPSLLLGLLALLLAARTGWFPVGGAVSAAGAPSGAGAWLLDRAHHLVLPVLCLTLPILAAVERVQCAAAESTAKEAFVAGATARGLGPRRIYLFHILLPSINPVLSISGPIIGGVLSGSLVLEILFSWPGLGQVTYEALYNRDPYLLMGCVLGSGLLLIAGNQIADLLLRILDPRTGMPGRRAPR